MSRSSERLPSRWSVIWSHAVAWILDHVYWRCKVDGLEHLPTGPVIVAGNHTSAMDGPVVLGAVPRGVHFLIKQELAKGLGGRILKWAGQVPVDRQAGGRSLRVCLDLLRRGRVVGIFPEGSRGDGRMSTIHPGVAWLAVHSGAPVVPFACLGTHRQGEGINHLPNFGRRLHVRFGRPLDLTFPLGAAQREQVAAAIGQIAAGLANHVAQAQLATGLVLPTDTGRKHD